MLDALDARARQSAGPQHQKRKSPRQTLRTVCRLRFLARDGRTPLESDGGTRDISRGGIGLVCDKPVMCGTDVRIAVRGPDERVFHLCGTVKFARSVKNDWSHLGIRFQPVSADRLAPFPEGLVLPVATPDPEECPDKPSAEEPAGSDRRAAARDEAIKRLAVIARDGARSKETAAELSAFTRDADAAVRLAAIPALVATNNDAAIATLVSMTSDSHRPVQSEAIAALGNLKAAEAAGPLRELLTHKDAEVAVRAACALARMKDMSAVPVLARELNRNESHAAAAAHAVGLLVDQRIRPNEEGVKQAQEVIKTLTVKH